jgi:phospholipid/cholesterol/gamma-HCH transport system substrate-binding protein
MRNTLETRLGVFVALAIIAAVLILELVGGVDTFRRGKHVYARFNNVQDLKKGNWVKMAGVEVGRVEDITLTNNKVMVEMKLHRNVAVKTDSIAMVKYTGLLGQNFVSLDFGSPQAPLADEGAILESKEQPDLSAIMQKIDNVATGVENLTRSFTGDTIDNLLGPLTGFIKDNRGPLTATIANFESISREISEGKGTVGKLVYDDALYTSALSTVTNLQDSVESAASELKTTLADARQIVDQINSGHGTVGKLVKDETLYKEATATMTNIREISQKINQGQGSVGKLINDQEFYRNAKLTLQKLDKATEGLEDQGPLSVLGLVVNNLF